MIGVALVAFVATLANGMKASNREAIEDQITANFIITSQDGYTPFVAAAGDAAADAPSAETVTHVRSEVAEIDGHGGYLTGIDPEQITSGYAFDWVDGSDATLAELGDDGIILSQSFAEDNAIAVGQQVQVLVGDGHDAGGDRQGHLRAAAVLPAPRRRQHLDRGVRRARRPAAQPVHVRQRRRAARTRRPGPSSRRRRPASRTRACRRGRSGSTRRTREFDQFLTMLYVLLALSVIISLFGMVNTLVLSVFERTRELGMLRAVGMTRRQARRMIRHESVITALIGAALGLPLGIFLAVLVTQALGEFDVRFSVPTGQLSSSSSSR